MDDGLRELVDAWLTKASHDLRAAEEIVAFATERLETDEN
jgi:hypothetical protein